MWRTFYTDIFSAARPKPEPGNVSDTRTKDDEQFLEESRQALEELETIRLAKLKIYEWRKKISIPGALILGPIFAYIDYWLLLLQSGSDDSGAGLTFLVLGSLYWWTTQPRRQYALAYKKEILPKLAGLFGDFTYMIDGKIPASDMQPSKILPNHDRYKSEDFFAGRYKGIDIQFSEIDLQQRRRNKKRTYYVSIFKGLAILLDTNHKRFYGHTIIDHNRAVLSEWFKEKSTGLDRADLVDPEFEKIFDAYTNDQVEARWLIDPIMIERLKGLYEEYEGEKMAAAFYENKMLILIASKYNHFEPAGIDTPAMDPTSLLNMKHEIGEILSIIDKLSLYDPDKVHEEEQTAAE